MDKKNKTLHKNYDPELFDLIRKFMGFSSSFDNHLYNIVNKEKFVKTIDKDKENVINAAFEAMQFKDEFIEKVLNSILKNKNLKNALKDESSDVSFMDSLKEKLGNPAYRKIVNTAFKDELITAISEYGFNKKDILEVYEIIKNHDTEEDRLEIEKLISKKPLIVPPGLNPAVVHFEAHFSVSEDDPIMILGRTGVGKSLFLYLARQLFKKKRQYDTNPPIIVEANCSHFSSGDGGYSLARSELFGHVKGSFTGADEDKVGLVEKANGGLLILEEVGELPFEVQAMLLTFIETGEYRRLGDENVRRATVKIVAATNRESALREDFRYRFFPYYIPPLRERKNDILYYFHEIFPDLTKNFSKSEVLLLLTHNWPGNVREIERIGRLLNRERWLKEQALKDTQSGMLASSTDRISHLDPQDTSFNPAIIGKLVQDLENWDVDISFLEKLLQAHRVSVNDETNQKAFKELSTRPSGYFSWFDEYTLTFCDEFGPFEDAYNGYMIFCDLFLQDPKKNDNILATIKNQCNSSAFNHMRYCFDDKPSYQRPLKNLRKKIMKCLMEFDSPEYDHIDNPWELWSILEQHQLESNKDHFSSEFGSEEVEKAITEYKEVDLLKLYYRKQLKKTGGNIKAAAKRVGMNENTFRNRLKKHGMGSKKK